MVWFVPGHVKRSDGSPLRATQYRVEAFFRFADSAEPGHTSASAGATGSFELVFPERERVADDGVRIVVSAPSGEILADLKRSRDALTDVLPIEIRDPGPIVLEEPSAPKQWPPRRLQARVIDHEGQPLPAPLQVLLFARATGAHPADPEQPILAARTDKAGYFFGTVPGIRFDLVQASVSGVAARLPVRLEDGLIAPRQVLVIQAPPAEPGIGSTDDCACVGKPVPPRMASHEDIVSAPEVFSADLGTGGCVQFNRPNRAIEEFDFYSVVRTTQPEINVVGSQGRPGSPPDAPAQPTEPAQSASDGTALQLPPIATTDFAAAGVPDLISERTALVRAQLTPRASFVQRALHLPSNTAVLRSLVFARRTAGVEFNVYGFRLRRRDGTESFLETDFTISGAVGSERRDGPRLPNDLRLEDLATVKVVRSSKAYGPQPPGQPIPVLPSIPARIYLRLASADTAPDSESFIDLHFDVEVQSNASEPGAGGNYDFRGNVARDDTLLLATPLAGAPSGTQPPERPAGASVSRPTSVRHDARFHLDDRNPIDWDATPTFYEATTIAHGHLLHYKQTWYADGYSMGDLLYSLPLAPGQKRLISVLDWERRETTTRGEHTSFDESLRAALSRDRDLGEVITGALSESARGGSRSTVGGIGFGAGGAANGSYKGINFGSLLGISGGYSDSSASAWQDSARNLSSSSLQNLRDKTLQSASAVRTLRSTLVQTASQGESVRGTTEVVANHNHCHALTVQYFEVLRHLLVAHELVDVQECLFVPLPMKEFDRPKALRWRQSLAGYLKRPELAPAFDAARRVETSWADADMPQGRYGDEPVVSIAGELLVTVAIPLPPFPQRPEPAPGQSAADLAAAVGNALNPATGFLGAVLSLATGGASAAVAQGARALAESLFVEPSAEARFARFQREVMPGTASGFIDQLQMHALTPQGLRPLQGVDFTLVSDYQPGVPLRVSVRGTLSGQLARAHISQIVIRSAKGLPQGCRAIVNAASLRYRSTTFEHPLVDDRRVDDDIDLPQVSISLSGGGLIPSITYTEVSTGAGVTLFTPLDAWEQRSPRKEDARLSAELLEHLNDHLEYYHHAIWWTMDPNRRYMLLDGAIAPNANGLSVASVVENSLIGIVGNSLVLPVARGRRLDPVFSKAGGTDAGQVVNLLEYYRPDYPIPPAQVSLPTRGVFAEAVMGSCNACEEIDDSRFWRWEESPIDEPPAIGTLSTDSRRSEPDYGKPTEFPNAVVAIQNAQAAPDPVGVKAGIDALAKPFADMSGLTGTQANAAAAYRQALETAAQFGKEASVLAQQAATLKSADKTLSTIDKAEAAGKLTKEEAKSLRVQTMKAMIGEPEKEADPAKAEKEAAADLVKNVPANRVTKVQTPGGTVVEAAPDQENTTPRKVTLTLLTSNSEEPDSPLFHVANLRLRLGAVEKLTTTRAQGVEFTGVPRSVVKLTADFVTVHRDNTGSMRWTEVPAWAEPLRDQINKAHNNFLGYTGSIAPILIPADGDQFGVKIVGLVSPRLSIQKHADLNFEGNGAEQNRTVAWADLMPGGATVPTRPDQVMKRLDDALTSMSRACVARVIDLYYGSVFTVETVALVTFSNPPTSASIEMWPTAFGDLKLQLAA